MFGGGGGGWVVGEVVVVVVVVIGILFVLVFFEIFKLELEGFSRKIEVYNILYYCYNVYFNICYIKM